MNIDFPPSSNGIYNNAGSSRQLVNYMEHEDMERIERGLFAEGFFNLTRDGIYKTEVIQKMDTNIGQLMKTDAKFYAIHVSPSAKELTIMGKTEQEQSNAMKRYIREVFIPSYAQNFNKGLDAHDILFYGKIHFSRERSQKASFMHCHLIVSRKDQSNKKKLSPVTNHRNTSKGAIKGGFDRKTLFQQAESGLDKLFGYGRDIRETFVYCNTMKNGSISEKLKMQERELHAGEKRKDFTLMKEEKSNIAIEPTYKAGTSNETDSLVSVIDSLLLFDTHSDYDENMAEYLRQQKKKKKKRGISR
ncbi:hypothetical protein EZS27_006281 [termite gut metagenome]|uniref:Clindamycin resistance transfer factor BtgB n=1 Tax=termite gut metagenome TaxID=433724 RepID=A0A5J4SIX5_9ZZZZ